jgi:hypothetical protein
MTSVETISAQHPKNARATIQITKGQARSKKQKKWPNDELSDQ